VVSNYRRFAVRLCWLTRFTAFFKEKEVVCSEFIRSQLCRAMCFFRGITRLYGVLTIHRYLIGINNLI
jgi:hypothetical protein